MRKQHVVGVDLNDADPTDAINAFLHVLNRQRALGLMPRTEHALAEHLLRGDVKIMFYSSAGGVISLVQSEESINDDDAFETLMFIMERKKQRLREKREAASAMSARSGETEGLAPKDASAVGDSRDAQTPAPHTEDQSNG